MSTSGRVLPALAGLVSEFNHVAPEQRPPRRRSIPPFSIRLSASERAHLEAVAGPRPLGAYIRSRLFGDQTDARRKSRRPSLDHQKLALVLAELGRSRLASNMNQIAKAANCGTLEISRELTADLQLACADIRMLRETLIAALGLKSQGSE